MPEAAQDQVPKRPRSRRRRIIWIAAVTVLVALLGTAAFATWRSRSEPAADRPTAGPSPVPSPSPSPSPEPGADVTGPLNILLVGVDTRVSKPDWQPHGDAVLVMHVTAGLDRAYLFALPRDLLVDLPSFPKADFAGERRTKLTHAMSYGSRVPDKPNEPDTAQGYELLASVVSDYTGIEKFDAGAVMTFQGFDALVDAVGGVDLYIDQRVVSIHRQPDGRHREPGPGPGGYLGPQMVYEKGVRHLNGWQALDYARQRYLTGGAYSRQRHQQQLIRAIVGKVLDQHLARDAVRLGQVLETLNKTLTFTSERHTVIDFAFALSGLRAEAITLVALPGHPVGSGNSYRGEELDKVSRDFLAALRAGEVDAFLAANPKLLVPDPPGTSPVATASTAPTPTSLS